MSELGLQTSGGPPERARTTTFLDLLRDQMDGLDRPRRRKRTLKERLRLKGIGCCGPTWGLRATNNATTLSARDDDDDNDNEDEPGRTRVVPGSDQGPSESGMNLATALAAERHYRTRDAGEEGNMTPLRVSLMRLLEETAEKRIEGRETERLTASRGAGNDSVCCVCMGRKKGAAFIPCGHTFCRVCSRELWLNRGSCPLCNRPISEILDIY